MTDKKETSEKKADGTEGVERGVICAEWRSKQPTHGPSYNVGKVGKWQIFTIHQSMIRGEHFILRICLPGIKESQPVETVESGKKEADRILNYWIKGLHI